MSVPWRRAVALAHTGNRGAAHGVAAAPVLGLEAHETHPHFRARNVVVPVTHPEAGEFALYRSPIGLSATPGHIDRAAPCLGEHNDHVFLDLLGLSPGEYEALKSDGVIR